LSTLIITVEFITRGFIIARVLQVRAILSANVKAERKKLGLSQEKLAEYTGLSTQTISDIEGCRTWVSDKTLLRLSEVLKVNIFQLLIPLPNENDGDEDVFLLQRINKLRQNMKDDIDKRLDQFFLYKKSDKIN
jgi:transcriptional regulator with XRE-family HTH domain